MDDFFFGKVFKGELGENELCLSNVGELAKQVSPEFFTAQLNRLLKSLKGKVMLSDGTSSPNFWEFISKLSFYDVGFIELYARTDINKNINATLACDIMLHEGVVTVAPHWAAYKEVRAKELISTLVLPLHLTNLHGKTYLRTDKGLKEPLLDGSYYRDELIRVFRLSKNPGALGSENEFDRWVGEIERASKYALRDIPLREIREIFYNDPLVS
ncbi:hypothetical protein ACK345_02360 [Aeromonas rivipollensis]|uniref:hypothetical protein n=1 Tax=Aeromonas rivipollensis TaxID=948519 RepID=UPI00398715C8